MSLLANHWWKEPHVLGHKIISILLPCFFFLGPVCYHCSNWWERLIDICRVLYNELSHGIESPHSVSISGNLITNFPLQRGLYLKSFYLNFFQLYKSQSHNHNGKQLIHLRPFCTYIIILFFHFQYSIQWITSSIQHFVIKLALSHP